MDEWLSGCDLNICLFFINHYLVPVKHRLNDLLYWIFYDELFMRLVMYLLRNSFLTWIYFSRNILVSFNLEKTYFINLFLSLYLSAVLCKILMLWRNFSRLIKSLSHINFILFFIVLKRLFVFNFVMRMFWN